MHPRKVYRIRIQISPVIHSVLPAGQDFRHAARNESGERSGVSPPVPRFCTGKLTHAARLFSQS